MIRIETFLTNASALAGMLLLLFAVSTSAATLTVTNTNDSGPGSLRSALVDPECTYFATDIVFAIPTSDPNYDPEAQRFTITLSSTLDPCLYAATTITNAMPQAVTIKGDDTFRIIDLSNSNSNVVITNLTISNGYSMDGGAIYTGFGHTLTLNDCTFENNAAFYAAGAIYVDYGATLNVNRNTFVGNSSDYGGAMYVVGTVFMDSSTLSGNSATGYGGGAIYNDGTLHAVNSTFSGNTGFVYGGAILNWNTITATNNTFVHNQASNGGGLLLFGISTLQNNIVALNLASEFGPDIYGYASGTYNLIGNIEYCDGLNTPTNLWGIGAAPLNPMVGPLQNNGGPTFTHALLEGSPAIDQGNSPAYFTDQRGYPRPSGSPLMGLPGDGSDMGSYERLGPSSATVTIGGRFLTSNEKDGRGISGVTVYLADQEGNLRTARTNLFGYFEFSGVETGKTYIASAEHRLYRFETRSINVTDEIADLVWIPLIADRSPSQPVRSDRVAETKFR
ncbi:MAG TPA: right-handed parallel beta-helix repeat-containing protein [Pyrinomonadaceae bacterium]|nr:right-handed parallel beta-helix repeat-containing protein [Pyrinomonadaceae bacterium]HMP65825.1 right-handed parallel beta-helix repeat-containing protein [Pyrinomonadaceae bacterium]